MSEWVEYKLQDVIEKFIDYRGKTPNKVSEGIPLITAKIIKDGSILKPDEFIKESDYLLWMTRGFPEVNDVLLTTEAPLGEVAILNDKNVALAQRIILLRGKKEILNNIFLFYSLRDDLMQHRLKARASGSTVQGIKSSELKEVMIPLPALEEQQRISDVLSCLDRKIENLRKQNETLEEIARSIFKHWFIDFEFPNADGKPYKSSGGVMVRSELGDIPEGWRVGIFQDFIENITDNRGKTPPVEENGILMMEGNQIICEQSFPIYSETSKQKYVSMETYNNWFRAGHPKYLDILCATVGTLPKWCFMPANKKICIAQNIIALRAKRQVCSPYWLRLFMNTRYFIQSVLGRLLTTAQPSIKVGHMMSIEVFIPELEISNKFSEIVKPLFQMIEVNSNQIQTLTKTRDTLLPKLMSGQLRVEV